MTLTIREIAKLAGVSSAAVSLVLNGKEGVSAETRARIEALLEEHQYKPKGSKRASENKSFVLLRFLTHGLIVEENQGFINSIINEIDNEVNSAGYQLTTITCRDDSFQETIKKINTEKPAGVIIIGSEMNTEQAELLRQIVIPKVVIDNSMMFTYCDSVVMSNIEIAFECVRYLYNFGHRKIGYLKSASPIGNFDERDYGYHHALKHFGIAEGPVFKLTPQMSNAYREMCEYLENKPEMPTAFFADNDMIAIGAMKAIQQYGYRIPDDVSVIGIDDIPFCMMFSPALTTMRISRKSIAKCAVTQLINRINDPGMPTVHQQILAKLISRESVRALK